jgi:hypothetical protein
VGPGGQGAAQVEATRSSLDHNRSTPGATRRGGADGGRPWGSGEGAHKLHPRWRKFWRSLAGEGRQKRTGCSAWDPAHRKNRKGECHGRERRTAEGVLRVRGNDARGSTIEMEEVAGTGLRRAIVSGRGQRQA